MKITRATLKSFVKKNREKLYINVKSDFDGCVDGCVDKKGGFHLALEDGTLGYNYHTLNIQGVWLTGRDYFCKFEDLILLISEDIGMDMSLELLRLLHLPAASRSATN